MERQGTGRGTDLKKWIAGNRILLALLLLAAAKSILWSSAIPPWRAPDEPQHFGYIQHLARETSVPLWERAWLYPDLFESLSRTNFAGITGASQTVVDTQARQLNPAAQHPPLFYTLALPFYGAAAAGSIETQLFAVRLLNGVFFVAMIGVAYRLGRRVFPAAPYLQIGVPLLMIFHPQLAFISAGAMNDALLTFLFTLFLYQLVVLAQGDFSLRRAALVGVVSGLGMITKSSFLLAFPIGFAVFAALLFLRKEQRLQLLKAGGVALAVSVPIFFWYFARNYVEIGAWQPAMMGERYHASGWLDLLFGTSYRNDLITSWLGNFSWMSIPLPAAAVAFFTRVAELSVAGLAAALFLGWRLRGWRALPLWVALLFIGVAGLFAASATYYELAYSGTQGRYLFPAEYPIASLLLVGLVGWMPPSWRPRATALVVSGAAVFAVWALFHEFIGRVS